MRQNLKLSKNTICILMATYNGAVFIEEQINSILDQSISDWILLIRDDGSSDETVEIIKRYVECDHRIVLVDDSDGNLGVNLNFNRLMHYASETECAYFCFSDQDDVWNYNKLDVMISELKKIEKHEGEDASILVYSDLMVVDSGLNLISNSFFTYQGLTQSTENLLGQVIVQNLVTGCATMFNRPLLLKSMPIPLDAVVHDWWLALCAVSYGHLIFIAEPLVKYRQHGRNQIGAVGVFNRNNPFKKFLYKRIAKSKSNFLNLVNQSIAFSQHLNKVPSSEVVRNKFATFSSILNKSLFNRIFIFNELKLHRSSFLGTCSLFFRIIFI